MLKAAKSALTQCMGISKKEVLLVITDEPLRKIGYAFWEAGRRLGVESLITEIIPRETNGAEPPDAVAELMAAVDVVIAPTSKSLSHTEARRNACAKGVRIATLPDITEDCVRRTLIGDYWAIKKLTDRLTAIVTKASTAHVTTPAGTDLRMSLKGRAAHPDTGIAHKKGDFTNLPAGEAYIAPIEGTAEGVFVVDGSMSGWGLTRSPIIIHVKKGFAVKFEGGKGAQTISSIVRKVGRLGANIAELGIGTNTKARVTGHTLEDEKAIGTVHVAVGDNRSMGGKVRVPLHLDGVMLKPTLTLDNRVIMRDGKLLV
ncbi:MAG: aminopeptidase [Candidatus Eisenbacteria bacterium]|nr:aminopeptidase [Candidatus Eisenbacteria bacterium]